MSRFTVITLFSLSCLASQAGAQRGGATVSEEVLRTELANSPAYQEQMALVEDKKLANKVVEQMLKFYSSAPSGRDRFIRERLSRLRDQGAITKAEARELNLAIKSYSEGNLSASRAALRDFEGVATSDFGAQIASVLTDDSDDTQAEESTIGDIGAGIGAVIGFFAGGMEPAGVMVGVAVGKGVGEAINEGIKSESQDGDDDGGGTDNNGDDNSGDGDDRSGSDDDSNRD